MAIAQSSNTNAPGPGGRPDDGGTYLVGGQIFHNYQDALDAQGALGAQMASGGSALLPIAAPGGSMTVDTQVALTQAAQEAQAATDATATVPVGSLLSPFEWLIVGVGGIVLIRMLRGRGRSPMVPSPSTTEML